MNGLADYGSSSDEDSSDEAMPPAPAPLPPAAALLRGPARPPTEASPLPSAAALLSGPARPPTERLGPARPPVDSRPAKRKRAPPARAPGGLMAPPQMRRPNVSTEAIGSWNSAKTTRTFQAKERDKLSRR